MTMFDSWGKWFRVMLTILLFAAAVYLAPYFVDLIAAKAAHIYHQFK